MASGTPTLVGTEPQTPLWLTGLGGGLFLLVGLFLVFRSPPEPRPAKEAPPAASAAAPSAALAPKAVRPGNAPGPTPVVDPGALQRLNDRLKAAPGGVAPAGGH